MTGSVRTLGDITRQQLRDALRGLRRTPGAAIAIVVTLALGIGANAMMFGVIDRLLLSPPQHLVDAGRLRHVYLGRDAGQGFDLLTRAITYPDFRDIQTLPALASVAGYTGVAQWTMNPAANPTATGAAAGPSPQPSPRVRGEGAGRFARRLQSGIATRGEALRVVVPRAELAPSPRARGKGWGEGPSGWGEGPSAGIAAPGTAADARRVRVQQATASFFPTLGVRPLRGRFYTDDEEAPGAGLTAVLSEECWTREFGRDPAIVGRALTLNRARYEVVGITPAGFTGADLGAVDVWLPLRASAFAEAGGDAGFDDRGQSWIQVVVRLKPGVASETADAQLTTAHVAARRAYEKESGKVWMDFRGRPYTTRETPRLFTASVIAARAPHPGPLPAGGERGTAPWRISISLWLAGVSGVVLLIACANVANLLLARGIRARRELAIRAALGANRRRLVGQLMTEAALLAGAGALAALALAWWSGGVVHALLVPDVAFTDTGMARRLLLFTAAAAALTTMLAGVLPAVQASRTTAADALRTTSRGHSSSRSRLRGVLMIGQVTLSVVLLVGAGLFVRSLWRAVGTDVGFDYTHTLVVFLDDNIAADATRATRWTRRTALFRDALARVSSLPGVRSAALSAATTPLWTLDRYGPLDRRTGAELQVPGLDVLPQTPGGGVYKYAGTEAFFETLGLAITRGRAFAPGEFQTGGEPVAMVNETFARTVWPDQDPLTRCVTYLDPDRKGEPAPCRRIVGVFRDFARLGLGDGDRRALQVAYPALPDSHVKGMIVRVDGDPASAIPSIRAAIVSLSPDVRFVEVATNADRFGRLLGPWRQGAAMFAAFGLLALIVAAVGLYSLLAFGVAQRRRELGIRAALGAPRRHLIRLVLAQAARVVIAGLCLGTAIALAAGRYLDSLLFGVRSTDPIVYLSVILALMAAGLVAALIPAWRATSVAPTRALAAE